MWINHLIFAFSLFVFFFGLSIALYNPRKSHFIFDYYYNSCFAIYFLCIYFTSLYSVASVLEIIILGCILVFNIFCRKNLTIIEIPIHFEDWQIAKLEKIADKLNDLKGRTQFHINTIELLLGCFYDHPQVLMDKEVINFCRSIVKGFTYYSGDIKEPIKISHDYDLIERNKQRVHLYSNLAAFAETEIRASIKHFYRAKKSGN